MKITGYANQKTQHLTISRFDESYVERRPFDLASVNGIETLSPTVAFGGGQDASLQIGAQIVPIA